jgi:spoIIIJ-associated protein
MTAQPKTILEEMLRHLDFQATVAEIPSEDGTILDITTDDSTRLIGRNGQILADLQYMVNRIMFQADPASPKVTVDVGGYRQQSREALLKRAKDAAERVRRLGDIVELEPMNAYDRRIVHQMLRDDPDVESHSVEIEASTQKVILLRPKSRA